MRTRRGSTTDPRLLLYHFTTQHEYLKANSEDLEKVIKAKINTLTCIN
jgi:hypothetical protein